MNSINGAEDQDQDGDNGGDTSRRPPILPPSSIDGDDYDRTNNNNTSNRKNEELNSTVGKDEEDDCSDASHTIKNFGIRSLLVQDLQKQLHHSMPSSSSPPSLKEVVQKPPPAPKLIYTEMRDLLLEFYHCTDQMHLITFIKIKKRFTNKKAIYRHWNKNGLKNMKKNIFPILEASVDYDSWCASKRGKGKTNLNDEPPNFGHYLNRGELIGDWDVFSFAWIIL